MQGYSIDEISFTHHTYKAGSEFIGYAAHYGNNAGSIKAEYLPLLKSVSMYNLVIVPEYRGIGIATSLINQLIIWTKALDTTKIICVLQSVLLEDSTTHFEQYLINRGFVANGFLLSKYLK